MSVTLKDIAKMAGVSISTVSRVINDDKVKPASKKTADKIWKIVKKVGYVPNQNARNLILGDVADWEKVRTKSIGCIYTSTKDSFGDPFFSHLGMGIKEQLAEEGYSLSFVMSIYEKPFGDMQKYLIKNPVDGIIVMGRFNQDTVNYLKKHCDRIIYAGVNYVDAGFDEIICDGFKGISDIVDYLVEMGHTKIGFIGDQHVMGDDYVVNERRYDAYTTSMIRWGLSIEESYIIHTKPYLQYAYETTKSYLEKSADISLPTAFVCTNDFTAIGALKAFQEAGVNVPEDVSIVGFDDIETALFVNPALTTVNVPKKELGRVAVKILKDKIENNRKYTIRVDIPYELIFRNSVKENKNSCQEKLQSN